MGRNLLSHIETEKAPGLVMIRRLGIAMGSAFLFGGLLGFVPGVVTNGLYLGIFMVNVPHNILHVVSGAIFIVASMVGAGVTRLWFRIFGSVYAGMAIWGLYVGDGMICGVISNNRVDAWGHAGLALAMLLIGFAVPKQTASPETDVRRPAQGFEVNPERMTQSLSQRKLQGEDNVTSRYHPALVALHWILAVMIIASLVMGTFVLAPIPNTAPGKPAILLHHMQIGIIILILMTARLSVRQLKARPLDAETGGRLLNTLARISHLGFYLLIFAQIASGVAMAVQAHLPQMLLTNEAVHLPTSFWIYPTRGVHAAVAWLLIGLIVLHLAGVAYHSLIRRDRLIRRMGFGPR